MLTTYLLRTIPLVIFVMLAACAQQPDAVPTLADVAEVPGSEPQATPELMPTFTAEAPTPTPSPSASALCWARTEAYREELAPTLTSKWLDAVELADTTSRIALSGPVGTLQAIRQEAEQMDVPECVQDEHLILVAAMQAHIDGFLAFMGDDPEPTIDRHFDRGLQYYLEYNEAVARLDPLHTPVPVPIIGQEVTYFVDVDDADEVRVTWVDVSGNETSGTYDEPFRTTFEAAYGTLLKVEAERGDASSITCRIFVESRVVSQSMTTQRDSVTCNAELR